MTTEQQEATLQSFYQMPFCQKATVAMLSLMMKGQSVDKAYAAFERSFKEHEGQTTKERVRKLEKDLDQKVSEWETRADTRALENFVRRGAEEQHPHIQINQYAWYYRNALTYRTDDERCAAIVSELQEHINIASPGDETISWSAGDATANLEKICIKSSNRLTDTFSGLHKALEGTLLTQIAFHLKLRLHKEDDEVPISLRYRVKADWFKQQLRRKQNGVVHTSETPEGLHIPDGNDEVAPTAT